MELTKFTEDVKEYVFEGEMVRVVNHNPVLTPSELEKRKDEIERQLFDVFKKYR
jgi:hypothetical protein